MAFEKVSGSKLLLNGFRVRQLTWIFEFPNIKA